MHEMNLDTLASDPGEAVEGTIIRKVLGHSLVRVGAELLDCSVSSKLRKHLVYGVADRDALRRTIVAVEDAKIDPLAIGDQVMVERADAGRGVIREILPRKTKFSRCAVGSVPVEQVIVANLDQVVVFASAAQPAPQWHLVDRYLIDAESASVPAIVCLTKTDLMKGQDAELIRAEMQVYERIGYAVVLTSSPRGEGVDEMKQLLCGRISVFVGKSGVGKTTLLNAIEPGLGLRVSEVSEDTGKGRHTTTHQEMFDVSMGDGVGTARIVDTPGVKRLGLWDPPSDMATLFPEMRPYLGQCRFGADCSHSHEPGCAIKQAVEAGHIAARRYESYLRVK